MQSRSWLFSYLALAVIWGLSFALIKQALAAMTPLQVTTARMGLGALTVCVFLLVARRFPRPNAREWRNLFVLGVVGLGLPFALIAFAETRITSILAGLLNSSVPLFAAIFVALLIPAERPDRTQVVGLLVGFAGIGVLVGVWNISTSGIDLVGVTAMILSGLCYGFGTAFGRVSMANSDLAGTQLTHRYRNRGTPAHRRSGRATGSSDPGDHRVDPGPRNPRDRGRDGVVLGCPAAGGGDGRGNGDLRHPFGVDHCGCGAARGAVVLEPGGRRTHRRRGNRPDSMVTTDRSWSDGTVPVGAGCR